MKINRLFKVSLLGLAILGMNSCTQEFTCKCVITYTGQPGLPEPITKEYPIKDTKSKAKSLCQGHSYSTTVDGIKTQEVCDLIY